MSVDLQDPVNGQIENVHIVKNCPFRVITSFHGIQLEYYEDVMGPDGITRTIPMRQDVGKPNPKRNEYVHPLGKAIYDLVMAYEEVCKENKALQKQMKTEGFQELPSEADAEGVSPVLEKQLEGAKSLEGLNPRKRK